MEERKTELAPKKALLDRNLSWPLMIVYLGYIIALYFVQRMTYEQSYLTAEMNVFLYYILAILGGVVVTFLIYNLGKIIAAKVGGYHVSYIRILGMQFDRIDGKLKFSYNILGFFTIALQFSPNDDDVEKKPLPIFLGGYIAEIILAALALVMFFVFSVGKNPSVTNNIGWTVFFGFAYGFIIPLYELLPFRQDYPTDMVNIMLTKSNEDKIAFNVYQINQERELNGKDFLVQDFDNYESFYKAHCLYPHYLQCLYESKLEKAYAVLGEMKYFGKYNLDDDRYLAPGEYIYLKYLINDIDGASKAFFEMKRDDRVGITKPNVLSFYRIGLLVLAYTNAEHDKIKAMIAEFDKVLETFPEPSKRVEKEKLFFNNAYNKIRKEKPELSLPERN